MNHIDKDNSFYKSCTQSRLLRWNRILIILKKKMKKTKKIKKSWIYLTILNILILMQLTDIKSLRQNSYSILSFSLRNLSNHFINIRNNLIMFNISAKTISRCVAIWIFLILIYYTCVECTQLHVYLNSGNLLS